MTLTREELEHLAGRSPRLTADELAQLPPETREIAKRLTAGEQQKLRELMHAQAAELAKLDAKIEKKARFIRKYAVRSRVLDALTRVGAGKNAELLAPHVEDRVQVVEQDGDIAGYRVVDKDGKVRLRDGRAMTVEELMSEVRRLPGLEDYFTKNGRQA